MDGNTKVVVVAKGELPTGGPALEALRGAEIRVCCDGAADALAEAGMEADVIIGDLDSLSSERRESFSGKVFRVEDQNSNDLTKAVNYCADKGCESLVILGATGRREDHSLGNISLMCVYARRLRVRILSDYGEFFLAGDGEQIPCRAGEQVSVFSLDNRVRVSSDGLLYPLEDLTLSHWYTASLNETTGNSFSLHFEGEGPLIVYRSFE